MDGWVRHIFHLACNAMPRHAVRGGVVVADRLNPPPPQPVRPVPPLPCPLSAALKEQQAELNAMWEEERDEMNKVQRLKGEIDRVNIEIQVGAAAMQLGAGLGLTRSTSRSRWVLRLCNWVLGWG